MLGTTVLYSSGDDGVAGNGGECLEPLLGMISISTSNQLSLWLRSHQPQRNAIQPWIPRHLSIRDSSRRDSDQSWIDCQRP